MTPEFEKLLNESIKFADALPRIMNPNDRPKIDQCLSAISSLEKLKNCEFLTHAGRWSQGSVDEPPSPAGKFMIAGIHIEIPKIAGICNPCEETAKSLKADLAKNLDPIITRIKEEIKVLLG